MSHLVPVVGCPLLILAVLRIRHRVLRSASAFIGGLLIAGFGVAVRVVVVAVSVPVLLSVLRLVGAAWSCWYAYANHGQSPVSVLLERLES